MNNITIGKSITKNLLVVHYYLLDAFKTGHQPYQTINNKLYKVYQTCQNINTRSSTKSWSLLKKLKAANPVRKRDNIAPNEIASMFYEIRILNQAYK